MAKKKITPAELRREYHREWRRKNPDKLAAAQTRYWSKKAKEAVEREANAEEQ